MKNNIVCLDFDQMIPSRDPSDFIDVELVMSRLYVIIDTLDNSYYIGLSKYENDEKKHRLYSISKKEIFKLIKFLSIYKTYFLTIIEDINLILKQILIDKTFLMINSGKDYPDTFKIVQLNMEMEEIHGFHFIYQ